MSDDVSKVCTLPFKLHHASTDEELRACFPVIALLRTYLVDCDDWVSRAKAMMPSGYRVLAAWQDGSVVAFAGYRIMENLIHHRFLYVDDLVTLSEQRGQGLGAALLKELAAVGSSEKCNRLVLDTAVANSEARRFYKREGLVDVVVGFIKAL